MDKIKITQCQNCKQDFRITSKDFLFYERIKVPSPTWCPECRMVRRMIWRNQRTLFKRKVDGAEDEVLSFLPTSSNLPVYYKKNWRSKDQNNTIHGRAYDFSKPFFTQIKNLMQLVPWQHIANQNSITSEYCSNSMDLKNCYMLFNAVSSENCMFGDNISKTRDSLDLNAVTESELCYELFGSEKCSRCFFSSECMECTNVYFSYDLTNCHNCIGCVGLRHKQYCIFNVQYTKEEYMEKLKSFDFGSYQQILDAQKKSHAQRIGFPVKYMHGHQNISSTGDWLENSKNAQACFSAYDLENCAYCQLIYHGFGSERDSYDITVGGGERCYELSIAGGYNVHFSSMVINDRDISYSLYSFDCANIFGCIGLHDEKYCILNKRYTKEEYKNLVPKIIKHMNEMPYVDQKGRIYKYGEFFPPELSPWAYNDTIANEYFPLPKNEVLEKGYVWRDPEKRNYNITIMASDLPDHISDVPETIINDIIGCAHKGTCSEQCTTAFRIIPQELEFYREMNLPLPRLCSNCRHYKRIKQRNPLKLWHQKCTCVGIVNNTDTYKNSTQHFHNTNHCPNEFETSYAPNRSNIVYCESCYNSEVT